MDEMDAHLRNLKVTVEKIRNLENENCKEPVEKPRSSENENFKEIIQRLRNLQTERKSLLLEIEELKKMAEAKATDLENEVSALRDEINSLKMLMTESEPSLNKRKSEAFRGNPYSTH